MACTSHIHWNIQTCWHAIRVCTRTQHTLVYAWNKVLVTNSQCRNLYLPISLLFIYAGGQNDQAQHKFAKPTLLHWLLKASGGLSANTIHWQSNHAGFLNTIILNYWKILFVRFDLEELIYSNKWKSQLINSFHSCTYNMTLCTGQLLPLYAFCKTTIQLDWARQALWWIYMDNIYILTTAEDHICVQSIT